MYEYIDKQPEVGDVVECVTHYGDPKSSSHVGEISIVLSVAPDTHSIAIPNMEKDTIGIAYNRFKVIVTKPGTDAKIGDTCIRIKGDSQLCALGSIFTAVEGISSDTRNYYRATVSVAKEETLVLCKTKSTRKAYYKRSGTPWTDEELGMLPNLWRRPNSLQRRLKWIFESHSGNYFMWKDQDKNLDFKTCTQVAFEDEFPTNFYQAFPTANPCCEVQIGPSLTSAFQHDNAVDSATYTTSTKENSVKTLQDLINELFEITPATDYEKKPDYLVTIYNNTGTEIAQAISKSLEDVETKIQSTPSLWGCKAVCYKIHTEVTTQVPVIRSKIK